MAYLIDTDIIIFPFELYTATQVDDIILKRD